MYELKVRKAQARRFKQVARSKMVLRNLRMKDLAELSGYSPSSLYNFFSDGNWNRFLAATLAEKLDIKEREWR